MLGFGLPAYILLASAAYFFASVIIMVVITRRASGTACERDAPCPRAIVLMCVRGAEPRLGATLQNLLNQNYPDYEVRIVVDSRDDPAWPIIQQAVANSRVRVAVDALGDRLPSCSFKCSSLVQLSRDIGPDREVIAMVDADTELDALWLRKLTAPFADAAVGLTSGNRWCIPQDTSWGSLVNYLWNALAFVPMYVLRTPWAGSMAIAADAFRKAKVPELWARAICDDASIRSAVTSLGRRIHFVPDLLIPTRVSSRLPDVMNFVVRQSAWTRIYLPRLWGIVLAVTWTILVALWICLAQVVVASFTGQWSTAALPLAALAVFQLNLVVLLCLLEWSVWPYVAGARESLVWRSPAAFARTIVAIGLLEAILPILLHGATFKREFRWRGVTYEVRDAWQIGVLGQDV